MKEVYAADITVDELPEEERKQVFKGVHPRYILNPFSGILYDSEKFDPNIDELLGLTV